MFETESEDAVIKRFLQKLAYMQALDYFRPARPQNNPPPLKLTGWIPAGGSSSDLVATTSARETWPSACVALLRQAFLPGAEE